MEATESSLSVSWSAPVDVGTHQITRFVLWACEQSAPLTCVSQAVERTAGRATVGNLPGGANYTLAVEVLTEIGSSGNASVSGGDGQAGPVFTTHAPPLEANAPFGALTAGLDNESSVHAMWWPPYGNGLPLLSHELLIDSGATDEASLVAVAELEAVCDGSGSGGTYVDPGCWHPVDADPSCGAAGYTLCRECVAGAECPPRGALTGAEALGGGGLRLTLPAAATGPMQAVLKSLPTGSLHTAHVRARNALGFGAFSAEGTLATAGELPVLIVSSSSALTAETAGASGGGVMGALVLALCLVGAWKCFKCCKAGELEMRAEGDKTKKKAEVEAVDETPVESDQQQMLWSMLENTLARTEVGGVDDAADVEVSRVLAYLAKEQVKMDKEADKDRRKKSNPTANVEYIEESSAGPEPTLQQGKRRTYKPCSNVNKLRLGTGRKGKSQGAPESSEEIDRMAVNMYLSRHFGAEPLTKRSDPVDATVKPLWANAKRVGKTFRHREHAETVAATAVRTVREQLTKAVPLPEPDVERRSSGGGTRRKVSRFSENLPRTQPLPPFRNAALKVLAAERLRRSSSLLKTEGSLSTILSEGSAEDLEKRDPVYV